LAVVGLLAASVAVFLLVRVLYATQEVARLLRTERLAPVVTTAEEDASPSPEATRAVDAGLDASERAPRVQPRAAEPEVDAGEPIDAAPFDVVEEPVVESIAGSPIGPGLVAGEPQPGEPPKIVRCGWRICPEGEVCCNWSCSTCAPPGQPCSIFCGTPSLPISTPCGINTCNVTEICCNRSCGICVPSGETCSQEPCPDTIYDPFSAPCGLATCNVGEVCCNPSCGICTKPGESCSLAPCR
jgi:hypothetical protein